MGVDKETVDNIVKKLNLVQPSFNHDDAVWVANKLIDEVTEEFSEKFEDVLQEIRSKGVEYFNQLALNLSDDEWDEVVNFAITYGLGYVLSRNDFAPDYRIRVSTNASNKGKTYDIIRKRVAQLLEHEYLDGGKSHAKAIVLRELIEF